MFPVRTASHSWDRVLVWGMAILTIGLGALMYNVPQKSIFWMTMLLMGGIIAYFAYAIQAMRSLTYRVDENGIGIQYGLMRICIPFTDILRIETKHRANLARLAGSEWPGFYSGYFSEFGDKRISRVYATQMNDVIKITVLQYNYVITPEDNESFLAEVQSYWHPHPSPDHALEQVPEGPALWQTGPGKWGLILNLAALLGLGLYIYHLTTTVTLMPMHYNIHGQVDRYGSPVELYPMLIAPLMTALIIFFISNMLSRKGIRAWESAALLLIPLATTIFMAVIVVS